MSCGCGEMSDGKAEDGGEGSGSVYAVGGVRGRGCISGTMLSCFWFLCC